MATAQVTQPAVGASNRSFAMSSLMLTGCRGGHAPGAVGLVSLRRAPADAIEVRLPLGFMPSGCELAFSDEALPLGVCEVSVRDPDDVRSHQFFRAFSVPGPQGRDDVLVPFGRALDTLGGTVRELGAQSQRAPERLGGGDHVDQAGIAGGPGDQLVELVPLPDSGRPRVGRDIGAGARQRSPASARDLIQFLPAGVLGGEPGRDTLQGRVDQTIDISRR